MPCDVTKLSRLPTFNTGEELSLSVHGTFDLTPYTVVGFFAPPRNRWKEDFSHVLERLESSSSLNQVSHQVGIDGYDQQFLELAFGMEADVLLPYLFQYGHCCCDRGDRCADFALQVPSFNRVPSKLDTSFSVSPSMMTLARVMLVQFAINLK